MLKRLFKYAIILPLIIFLGAYYYSVVQMVLGYMRVGPGNIHPGHEELYIFYDFYVFLMSGKMISLVAFMVVLLLTLSASRKVRWYKTIIVTFCAIVIYSACYIFKTIAAERFVNECKSPFLGTPGVGVDWGRFIGIPIAVLLFVLFYSDICRLVAYLRNKSWSKFTVYKRPVLVVLGLYLIGTAAVFSYSISAKNLGIFKFKNGGYMVVTLPPGISSYERETGNWRLTTAMGDYRTEMRISKSPGSNEEIYVYSGEEKPIESMDLMEDSSSQKCFRNEIPAEYITNKDIVASLANKKYRLCIDTFNTINLNFQFEIEKGKNGIVSIHGYSKEYIEANLAPAVKIINSARYISSMWSPFAFFGLLSNP